MEPDADAAELDVVLLELGLIRTRRSPMQRPRAATTAETRRMPGRRADGMAVGFSSSFIRGFSLSVIRIALGSARSTFFRAAARETSVDLHLHRHSLACLGRELSDQPSSIS